MIRTTAIEIRIPIQNNYHESLQSRQSAKVVEKDFPHFVDMFVPDGGLGRRLDTMYEWHRTRGIESHHGRGRRTDEGRYYVRWCFADVALARAFADKFGT